MAHDSLRIGEAGVAEGPGVWGTHCCPRCPPWAGQWCPIREPLAWGSPELTLLSSPSLALEQTGYSLNS